MPAKHDDLHGNVPDTSPTALLLVDVINDMEFETGNRLLEHALPAARRLAALARRARDLGIPVIYANDNFGRWRSDFSEVVRHCLEDGVRGEPIARLLQPEPDDYFVLKPKHSAFYETTLELLLRYLEVDRVILGGFSGDICVLFTAGDAHMRDLHLHIPEDCVASANPRENARILAYMKRNLDAQTTPSGEIDLEALRRRRG
jgi:nicotinamidase-related amidase